MSLDCRNTKYKFVIPGGVGVGWGKNVHVNLNTHGLYDVHLVMGWGSTIHVNVNKYTRHATLWDLLLNLHTHVMLRSAAIFSCTCTHTHASCYALGSSAALAHTHTHHASLCYLLLYLHTHRCPGRPDPKHLRITACWKQPLERKKQLLHIRILKLHVDVSFSFSRSYTTSEITNSCVHKLVSESLSYASEMSKTNVSFQTRVEL